MAVEREIREDGVRVPETGPDTGTALRLTKGYPPVLGAMLLIDAVAALASGYRASVSLGEAVVYVLLPPVAMVLVDLLAGTGSARSARARSAAVPDGARAVPGALLAPHSFPDPDAAFTDPDPEFTDPDPAFAGPDAARPGPGDAAPGAGRSRVRWLAAAGAALAALFAALFLGGGVRLFSVPAWAEAAAGTLLLAATALLFAPRRQHVGRRRA